MFGYVQKRLKLLLYLENSCPFHGIIFLDFHGKKIHYYIKCQFMQSCYYFLQPVSCQKWSLPERFPILSRFSRILQFLCLKISNKHQNFSMQSFFKTKLVVIFLHVTIEKNVLFFRPLDCIVPKEQLNNKKLPHF